MKKKKKKKVVGKEFKVLSGETLFKVLAGNDLVKIDGDKYFYCGPTLCVLLEHHCVRKYLGDVVDGTLFAVRTQRQWRVKSEGWFFNLQLFKRPKKLGIKRLDLRAEFPDGKKFHGKIEIKKVKALLRDELLKLRLKENTTYDSQVLLQPKHFR